HMDSQIIPRRHHPARLCLGGVPGRRNAGVRPLKHSKHPSAIPHTLPHRVTASQMALQMPERSFLRVQMEGQMVSFDTLIISNDQQPQTVVANVLLELVVVVFLEMVWGIHFLLLGWVWP